MRTCLILIAVLLVINPTTSSNCTNAPFGHERSTSEQTELTLAIPETELTLPVSESPSLEWSINSLSFTSIHDYVQTARKYTISKPTQNLDHTVLTLPDSNISDNPLDLLSPGSISRSSTNPFLPSNRKQVRFNPLIQTINRTHESIKEPNRTIAGGPTRKPTARRRNRLRASEMERFPDSHNDSNITTNAERHDCCRWFFCEAIFSRAAGFIMAFAVFLIVLVVILVIVNPKSI